MKVLVVGGGGREHAIVRALGRSPQSPEVICAPGNAGIAEDVRCLPVTAEDVDGIIAAAKEEAADLVVVGPEAPLVAGLVDALEAEGVAAFGPSRAASQIEGSKVHAKELMAEAGVPTAGHVVVSSRQQALDHLSASSYPTVLKADGLAAGKGVIVCADEDAARAAVEVFFSEQRFGATDVVIEEFLEGSELSLLALCDGENVLALAPAQDYKRALDGDQGPNTGGMGSYSPVPGVDDEAVEQIVAAVHGPIVETMARRGTPYRGVLYAGLMLTADGPKVIEFNCRFGDPETQAVLALLRSDLLELFTASRVQGGLAGAAVRFDSEASVTVVLASAGYPASSSKGDVISGLDRADAVEGVDVLHAGTATVDGSVVTAGGRVLAVTALGETMAEARDRAYEAADLISFEGMQRRSDIALRAVA